MFEKVDTKEIMEPEYFYGDQFSEYMYKFVICVDMKMN